MQKNNLKPEQALKTMKHFCAYQERCHSEVNKKLYELNIYKKDRDNIIATLIEENYLNEERFAIAFAGGKFRIKHWGRVKIKEALKQKFVSEYCIKKAMKEIDDADYEKKLTKLASEKYNSLKGEQYLVRQKKTMNYLQQKGYEFEFVKSAIENLRAK